MLNELKMIHNINFGMIGTKYMHLFFNMKELVMEHIQGDNVQKTVNELEKGWLKDKTIIKNQLSETGINILKSILVKDYAHKLELSFKYLPHDICNMYLYQPRQVCTSIKNISIKDNTAFTLRNSFNAYGDEGFIFSLSFDKYAISIEATTEGANIKGAGNLRIAEATDKHIYIDLAEKYIDIQPFIKWLR